MEVAAENQEIDPDDDMAGLMREMNDSSQKKPIFNESLNSEASTDTAFSLTAQMSDKDEFISVWWCVLCLSGKKDNENTEKKKYGKALWYIFHC